MIRLVLATVPWRRASAQYLLDCLAKQTRVPDAIDLLLDGYDAPGAPPEPVLLNVLSRGARVRSTAEPVGPGARWWWVANFEADDVAVVLDDEVDHTRAPTVVEDLSRVVLADDVATAASGVTANGSTIAFDDTWIKDGRVTGRMPYDGPLASFTASAFAVRAGRLKGIAATHAKVRAAMSIDPFGIGGDDEAVVSAHLWSVGCEIRHVGVPGLTLFPGTQDRAELHRRQAFERDHALPFDWQRRVARQVTGWPWPEVSR